MNRPALPRLFHVSERPDIARFEPRPPPSLDAGISDDVVWAIAERLLPNYLLPRDCPRVTFHLAGHTTATDRDRFFPAGATPHVVAVEAAWRERIHLAQLSVYELPPATFTLADATAAYWVSRQAVVPLAVHVVSDLAAAHAARPVELRFVPSLWPLRDAVFASTLGFSFIRMRHAQPRSVLAMG